MQPESSRPPLDASDPGRFITFGFEHRVILLSGVALCVLLPWVGLRLEPEARLWLGRGLAVVLSSAVVVWTVQKGAQGQLSVAQDLPLDLCNLLALLAPAFAWRPDVVSHEIMYYMVMAGSLQAIVTPHLETRFPHPDFVKYWIVHWGLVVYVIYVSVALGVYPSGPGILWALLAVLAYIPVLWACNYILGANYGYVMAKPPTASLLDYMGPWPWYIVFSLVIAVGLFWLAYLPFALASS